MFFGSIDKAKIATYISYMKKQEKDLYALDSTGAGECQPVLEEDSDGTRQQEYVKRSLQSKRQKILNKLKKVFDKDKK